MVSLHGVDCRSSLKEKHTGAKTSPAFSPQPSPAKREKNMYLISEINPGATRNLAESVIYLFTFSTLPVLKIQNSSDFSNIIMFIASQS